MNSIRREMEVCPHCRALESAKIYATKRDVIGNICRYRKCKVCGKIMPMEILFLPKKTTS